MPQVRRFRVTNVGAKGSVLTGSVVVAGSGFTVDPGTAALNLPRGKSQLVVVTFQTSSTGPVLVHGTATVSCNASGKTPVVKLNGKRK